MRGRKRGLAADVLGLAAAVVVLAASAHDNTADTALLDRAAAQTDTVQTTLADQGLKNAVADHGAALGIGVDIIQRNPADRGFVPQPKRWVVEQTYRTLALHRRLLRDYEHRPASSESHVYWTMSDATARRPTHTSTPSRRGA
ncbi:hypothetical protein HDA32_005601 [Spinactinospora alkalitolerans]|uniref:Transposase n=1 Tax=Spinactinospora alkalitolerans TaxID=687207 RepID=A0A852U2V2_9ACTN|nr:hypothetical protein [Spinactinospora alkalitolerans]NYE50481.1 hypothetical protein [Spinactinospora alkalitolerans]